MDVRSTTLFGGKPYPKWQEQDFSLPGYKNAKIILQNKENNAVVSWGFMVSPSSLNIQMGNDIQKAKTMSGWVITNGGPALGTLSLSGVFLDTLTAPERLRFFWNIYTQYIQDQQDRYLEYDNLWKQTICVEGVYYDGIIESFTQTKNAQSPFLYQYSISFTFYKTRNAYSTSASGVMSDSEMKRYMGFTSGTSTNSRESVSSVTSNKKIELASGVLSVLNR